jgi:hypothetical protein
MPPNRSLGLGAAPPPSTTPPVGPRVVAHAARNGYQSAAASSDRSTRCPNRNGVWPPLYKRQWNPHPPRSQSNNAQVEWQRCVHDAVAAGELHRTTGAVLLAFCRASSNRLDDVWIAQATVAGRLGLAASTVCHHVAAAKHAGWIQVQHRNRIDNGVVVGMSNVTRLELPAQWRTKLDEQRRQRAADRTRDRRRQPGRHTPRPHQPVDNRPPSPTPADHAAGVGAAIARAASTLDFEDGRRQVAEQFHGQSPGLYEAAYDSFVETWKTVRLNQ